MGKHSPVVEKSICTMAADTPTTDSCTFSLKKTGKLIEIALFYRQRFNGQDVDQPCAPDASLMKSGRRDAMRCAFTADERTGWNRGR